MTIKPLAIVNFPLILMVDFKIMHTLCTYNNTTTTYTNKCTPLTNYWYALKRGKKQHINVFAIVTTNLTACKIYGHINYGIFTVSSVLFKNIVLYLQFCYKQEIM